MHHISAVFCLLSKGQPGVCLSRACEGFKEKNENVSSRECTPPFEDQSTRHSMASLHSLILLNVKFHLQTSNSNFLSLDINQNQHIQYGYMVRAKEKGSGSEMFTAIRHARRHWYRSKKASSPRQ